MATAKAPGIPQKGPSIKYVRRLLHTYFMDAPLELDLLKYCLNPRFNHLFRCVEPAITSTIADKLDKWLKAEVTPLNN